MTPELRAACDEIMTYANGVLEKHSTDLLDNAVMVAKALLASYPTDDDEPITLEYAEEILHDSDLYVCCLNGQVYAGIQNRIKITTRRQLRLLLEALGIGWGK